MKINDRVKATYFDHVFTGIIDAYDTGGVYVKPDEPFEMHGTIRDGVYFWGAEVKQIELIEEGQPVECTYRDGFCWIKK